jgi:hypothetical protein
MDIQVIYMRDVLTVSSITNVPNMVPRTLDVRGPDFRGVTKVEVNEEEAPSFVVTSSKRILVQVPSSQERAVIKSIAVLSDTFTKKDKSQVRFELTNNPKKVDGLMRLIQIFLLHLLRTPGTDAWYPNSGGGIQKLVGSYFSKNNSGAVTAAFTLAVGRTRSQIISMQAGDPRVSADEKLATVNVLSASFSVAQTALLARVELVSQSGKRAAVGLEL